MPCGGNVGDINSIWGVDRIRWLLTFERGLSCYFYWNTLMYINTKEMTRTIVSSFDFPVRYRSRTCHSAEKLCCIRAMRRKTCHWSRWDSHEKSHVRLSPAQLPGNARGQVEPMARRHTILRKRHRFLPFFLSFSFFIIALRSSLSNAVCQMVISFGVKRKGGE